MQQGLSSWAVCVCCCTSGACTQQLLAQVLPGRRNSLDHAGNLLQTAHVHCRPPRVISTSAYTAVAAAGMGVTISMPPEDDGSSDSDARSDSDDEDYLSESLVCAQPGLLLVELLLYTCSTVPSTSTEITRREQVCIFTLV